MSKKSRVSMIEVKSPRSRSGSRAESEEKNAINLTKLLQDDPPNFKEAKKIIKKYPELAYKDIQFQKPKGEFSVASYLTHQFHTFKDEIKAQTCDFIEYINDKSPNNEPFKDVRDTIDQLTVRDKKSIPKYELLFSLTNNFSVVSSAASESEEKATPKEIVEHTLAECIIKFDDKNFDVHAVIEELIEDTMRFGQAVSFEELRAVVKELEKTLKDPKDPQWKNFRFTIGEITNQTAEHYIEENERVDRNQKLLLLCCLTVIGIIVPILYYNLKVKPTREASPLVVYEMTREAFVKATEKKTSEAKRLEASTDDEHNDNFDGKRKRSLTVHRLWVGSIHRRFCQDHQPRLISDKGQLKRTVLFSSDYNKNSHLFNGELHPDDFQTDSTYVRWIALKGDQAKQTEEKLDGQEYNIVLGAAAG